MGYYGGPYYVKESYRWSELDDLYGGALDTHEVAYTYTHDGRVAIDSARGFYLTDFLQYAGVDLNSITSLDFYTKDHTSGVGKSTIAKLLCRFWDVQDGRVRIGGQCVRDISFAQLMNAISYVSQDNFLFDMSIMENLRLGNPQASDEEVIKAARQAQCHDFIMQLPEGYSTLVG